MQPVYDRIQQDQIARRIEEQLGETYSLWWSISIASGGRTSDVCAMKFSDIDLEAGVWKYKISKQSLASESRAFNKVLKVWKERLKKAAMVAGEQQQYMIIDMTNFKNIVDLIPSKDMAQLESELSEAVNNAEVKTDTKQLPKKVIELIRRRKEQNKHDDFVFSRSMLNSNRARNLSGHIQRQAIWKALKTKVFNWFAETINGALKLSAYSSRKTFAYRMLRGVNGKGNNIAEVMQAFGHSSISMTMKYLGLASKAQELQAELCEV
jgi:integrase